MPQIFTKITKPKHRTPKSIKNPLRERSSSGNNDETYERLHRNDMDRVKRHCVLRYGIENSNEGEDSEPTMQKIIEVRTIVSIGNRDTKGVLEYKVMKAHETLHNRNSLQQSNPSSVVSVVKPVVQHTEVDSPRSDPSSYYSSRIDGRRNIKRSLIPRRTGSNNLMSFCMEVNPEFTISSPSLQGERDDVMCITSSNGMWGYFVAPIGDGYVCSTQLRKIFE